MCDSNSTPELFLRTKKRALRRHHRERLIKRAVKIDLWHYYCPEDTNEEELMGNRSTIF